LIVAIFYTDCNSSGNSMIAPSIPA